MVTDSTPATAALPPYCARHGCRGRWHDDLPHTLCDKALPASAEPLRKVTACSCGHPLTEHYANGCGWCICKVAGTATEDADQATTTAATVHEHDLPMLRVHRAWEAAEKIAEAHDIDRGVALAIARKVIGIVGDGTRRWGHLCTACRSLVTWDDDNGPTCPEHGRLGHMASLTLLISFDPIGG